MSFGRKATLFCLSVLIAVPALADENLFGYLKGSETLPAESWELYQYLTSRTDKGRGTYRALDTKTEVEYGVTDRFTTAFGLKMQSIESQDLLIDAYIPKDINSGLELSGAEMAVKYNFLSPAKDDIGLSTYTSLDYSWLDSHSGQKKDSLSFETKLLVQKYFLEGELIWVSNFGIEATYARRHAINDLPDDFEWPSFPEMEIELSAGMGLSYRFVPKWFVGGEFFYESEYETEVGQERWSLFAGPSLHYASQGWWSTLTWIQQLQGGGPPYTDQSNTNLHLIEKTMTEIRFKLGLEF